MIPNVLTIAGSDPSGGAGIQADLKTFAALRCYGLSVITALTAQNTQGVFAVAPVAPEVVAAQLDALSADGAIAAVKIGMTASAAIIDVVAQWLQRARPPAFVLDPVLAASGGASLAEGSVVESLMTRLAPLVTLVTPNLAEAAALAKSPLPQSEADIERVARALHAWSFAAILVKGGHRESPTSDDLLFDGKGFRIFSAPRIATKNTHGTGCTLASAIAAYLAQGHDLAGAVAAAKTFVSEALAAADQLNVGQGTGPLNHFHRLWQKD